MRVSLYKHELEAIIQLTVSLARIAQTESGADPSAVGPEIFAKLVDILYANGTYQHPRYRGWQELRDPSLFAELDATK
jgi:hypothetical protein